MFPKKLWINLPDEYCEDMHKHYMQKYREYRALAEQLDEHKSFLQESSALFYFAANAFMHYPSYLGSSNAPHALDELQRYIVKTDFVEFINACNFVICYSSESQMMQDWGGINIRSSLSQKYESIKELLLNVYGIAYVDIENCNITTIQELISVSMKYLNRDGYGCYDVR